MTTCAITECRNEGVLLLHIRHRKENLLQAEYCAEHFCTLAKQWIEDIQLAQYTKTRLVRSSFNNFYTCEDTIASALPYVWKLKESLPRHTSIDEIFDHHVADQHRLEEIISQNTITDKNGITRTIYVNGSAMK